MATRRNEEEGTFKLTLLYYRGYIARKKCSERRRSIWSCIISFKGIEDMTCLTWTRKTFNIRNFLSTILPGPLDLNLSSGGTRLLAVLTFGGINFINFPSGVVTLPIVLTTTGLAAVDEDPSVAGIVIFIGLPRNGELMPILGTVIVLEVVGTLVFFVEKDAAVSRSFPPPLLNGTYEIN